MQVLKFKISTRPIHGTCFFFLNIDRERKLTSEFPKLLRLCERTKTHLIQLNERKPLYFDLKNTRFLVHL